MEDKQTRKQTKQKEREKEYQPPGSSSSLLKFPVIKIILPFYVGYCMTSKKSECPLRSTTKHGTHVSIR